MIFLSAKNDTCIVAKQGWKAGSHGGRNRWGVGGTFTVSGD